MDASRFIARRLRFKGNIAMSAIAISFLIMIMAVAISSGFRQEIRKGVSSFAGDIQLTPCSQNYMSDEDPVNGKPSYLDKIKALDEVEKIEGVIYRGGIVKGSEDIQGILFKGIADSGLESLEASIPEKLAKTVSLSEGDKMIVYFIGEKVKARKFTVKDIYSSPLETDQTMMVRVPLEDLRKLNGWDEDEVSAIEISLKPSWKSKARMQEATDEIGTLTVLEAQDDSETFVCRSIMEKFPQLFDWLDLIDFNVVMILILMTIVAGFNMISGLLILLFQNISTIGIMKSMGMTDKSIVSVFLKVSSNLVLKGMLIGNAVALLLCLIQGTTHLIKLNPANYFVSFVPVAPNIPVILMADVISYAAIMVLLLIPSLFISKVDPAQTVRAQ